MYCGCLRRALCRAPASRSPLRDWAVVPPLIASARLRPRTRSDPACALRNFSLQARNAQALTAGAPAPRTQRMAEEQSPTSPPEAAWAWARRCATQIKAHAHAADAELCCINLFYNGACYEDFKLNVKDAKFEDFVGAALSGSSFTPFSPVSATYTTDKDSTPRVLLTHDQFGGMLRKVAVRAKAVGDLRGGRLPTRLALHRSAQRLPRGCAPRRRMAFKSSTLPSPRWTCRRKR